MDEKVLKFEEMADAMNDSITNAKKVLGEQQDLIELVASADKEEHFKEFISDTKDTITTLTDQVATLEKRLALLNEVNAMIKESDDVKKACANLIDVLGLFQ